MSDFFFQMNGIIACFSAPMTCLFQLKWVSEIFPCQFTSLIALKCLPSIPESKYSTVHLATNPPLDANVSCF